MKVILEKAGLSFLRAVVGVVLVFAPGLLNAPNFQAAKTALVAVIVAAIAAGLKAVQVYFPQLSVQGVWHSPFAKFVDSFLRAFVGTLVTLLIGVLSVPVYHFEKAALLAVLVGAVTAGIRAVQALFTKGETPVPKAGAPDPPAVPAK